jgi:hypothetical protein
MIAIGTIIELWGILSILFGPAGGRAQARISFVNVQHAGVEEATGKTKNP